MAFYNWPDIPSALDSLNFESTFRKALENWKSNFEDMDARMADGGGYDYVWANYAARVAQSGMTTGERGVQTDNGSVYEYSGSAWVFKFSYFFPLVRSSVTFSGCSEFNVVYFDGTNYQPALADDAAIKESNLALALTNTSQVWTHGPIDVGIALLPNGTYPAGTKVYLSNSTAGEFTTTDTGVCLGTSLGDGVLNFNSTIEKIDPKIEAKLDSENVNRFRGTITNADTNPNYPAANAGDVYYIKTNSGKVGGASGISVAPDDRLECIVDSSPAGDHVTVGSNWVHSSKPVITSAADAYDAVFDRPNNIKTGNYTVDWNTDVGKTITLGSGATADSKFTIPATDSDNDRKRITFINDSDYILTLACNSADSIWNSDRGIELLEPGILVTLQSDFTSNKLRITEHAGGKVIAQGLALYLKMDRMYGQFSAYHQYYFIDDTGFCTGIIPNNSSVQVIGGDLDCFGTGHYWFAPIGSAYLDIYPYSKLNLLNSKDGFTLSVFTKPDVTTYAETYFQLFLDASNYFKLRKDSSGYLVFEIMNAGSATTITGTTALGNVAWHHLCVRQDTSGNLGLYLDGNQEGWLASASYSTLDLSSATIARFAGMMDGRLKMGLITKGNPYGAAPNSGMTDSFTVKQRYLNLVMK